MSELETLVCKGFCCCRLKIASIFASRRFHSKESDVERKLSHKKLRFTYCIGCEIFLEKKLAKEKLRKNSRERKSVFFSSVYSACVTRLLLTRRRADGEEESEFIAKLLEIRMEWFIDYVFLDPPLLLHCAWNVFSKWLEINLGNFESRDLK